MGTHDFTEGEGKTGDMRQASRTCGAARQEVGSGGDDDAADADADENMRLKLTTKRWCRSQEELEEAGPP